MRLATVPIAVLLGSLSATSAGAPAPAPGLPSTILRCLSVTSFDASCLGEFSTVVFIDDEHRHAYDRDEQINYFARLKRNGSPPIISRFKVLGELDNGAYASVSYSYILQEPGGRSMASASMIAYDVWEHGPSGWTRVTSVRRRLTGGR